MANKSEGEKKVRDFKEFGWKEVGELKLRVEALEEQVQALSDQLIDLTNRRE